MRHWRSMTGTERLRPALAGLTFVAVSAIGAQSALAGGLYLNEFATPSMGTAGAGQEAYANDASTSFALHNPAGMTRIEGHEISLGAGLLIGTTEFDQSAATPFNGGNGGDQAGLAPLLGTHGVYSATEDLKFGFSVFSVAGAALDPNNQWAGRYELQEITLLTVTANPSVAYRVNDWLSLGGGATIMYADLDYQFGAPPINPPVGGVGQIEVDGNDWAPGFNLGALFEIDEGTRLGITYVSEIELKFDGDISAQAGGGPGFTTSSDTELTFPQLIRVGAYHEIDDQWALLATFGWEDWSEFDSFDVSTDLGGVSVATDWKDTYHFSGGVHYQVDKDWLLQAGITYDTSPVSNGDRAAFLPIDRQIRYAVGSQYQVTENLRIGGALEYIDLGDAKIRSNTLQGEYDDNRIYAISINANYAF